jgi:hypothetical protein
MKLWWIGLTFYGEILLFFNEMVGVDDDEREDINFQF